MRRGSGRSWVYSALVVVVGACGPHGGGDSETDGGGNDHHDTATPDQAPEVSVSLSPATPLATGPVRAVVEASDPDGDDVSLAYAWTIDGAAAGDGTDTLTGGFVRGQEVAVHVVASDGSKSSSADATATVGNSPPSAPVVSVSPSAPREGDVLTCAVDVDATDPDGDAITYRFAWTVDGADAGDQESLVASASGAYACVVIANDGYDDGPAATASANVHRYGTEAIATAATARVDGGASGATEELTGAGLTVGDFDADGRDDVVAVTKTGSAYVVDGPVTSGAAATVADATLTPSSGAFSSALALDYDGDGVVELLLGNTKAGDVSAQGDVIVLDDPRGRLTTSAATAQAAIYRGASAAGAFASTLADGGDVDGDGRREVLVGTPADDHVDLVPGGLSGTVCSDDVSLARIELSFHGSELGEVSNTIGDLDGDGYDDLVVGDSGEAYVLYGPVTGDLDPYYDGGAMIVGSQLSGVVAADFDLDGEQDLVVTYMQTRTLDASGEAGVFSGAQSGMIVVEDARVHVTGASKGMLSSVAASDLDHDGFVDLVLGSQGVSTQSGEVSVLYGAADLSGWSAVDAEMVVTGDQAYARLGSRVAVGDIDGDGHGDVAVAASDYDTTTLNVGAFYVVPF